MNKSKKKYDDKVTFRADKFKTVITLKVQFDNFNYKHLNSREIKSSM